MLNLLSNKVQRAVIIIQLLFFSVGNLNGQSKNLVDSLLSNEISFLKQSLSAREGVEANAANSDSLGRIMQREIQVVEFFELLTGIHATIVHNYAMSKDYDEVLISKWENWISKNRAIIIYENDKKRLNRRDRNIYKE